MTNFKFNDLWHGSMLAALTACMAVGLVDVARSAPPDEASSIKVSYGDLNLANAQGVHTLHARVTAAAQQVCAPEGLEIRNLDLYSAERACISDAVANAERQVQANQLQATKVQATKVARVEVRKGQG